MLLDITNLRSLAPVAEDADGLFVRAPRPTRRWTTGGSFQRKPAPPPRRQSTPGCFHHKPSSAFRARRYRLATPAELLSAAAAASAAVDADAENADPQQDDGSASWVTMRVRGGGGLKPHPLSDGSGLTPRPPSDDIDSSCGAKTLRRSTGSGLLPAYYSSPQTPQVVARRRGGAVEALREAQRMQFASPTDSSPVNSEHAAVAAVAAAGADWQQLQIAELAA